jgi:hypothetical protein
MRWVGHIAHGGRYGTFTKFVRKSKSEGKNHVGDQDVDGSITPLKWITKEQIVMVWNGLK